MFGSAWRAWRLWCRQMDGLAATAEEATDQAEAAKEAATTKAEILEAATIAQRVQDEMAMVTLLGGPLDGFEVAAHPLMDRVLGHRPEDEPEVLHVYTKGDDGVFRFERTTVEA